MEKTKTDVRLISPETLLGDGFKAYKVTSIESESSHPDQLIFEKGDIRVTLSIRWQICDKEGYVGNEYIETMEELYKKFGL